MVAGIGYCVRRAIGKVTLNRRLIQAILVSLPSSMKKTTAILFFAIYLLSATEAHQLLKLPLVFEHYKEHQKEDGHLSMVVFLVMHYMHGSPKDKDYDKDMQLPFKTQDDCVSSISPAYEPEFAAHDVPAPAILNTRKSFILKNQFLLSSYLANIWQPPRQACLFI